MCEPSEMDGKSESELIAESQALAAEIEEKKAHQRAISQHLAARRKREEDLRAELARIEAAKSADAVDATVEGQTIEVQAKPVKKEK